MGDILKLCDELEALLEKATPGPWDVWRERTGTRDDAVAELIAQVESTEPFAGSLFLLNADGKCPAITGCGPTSEDNAALIVAARNALPTLLQALRQSENAVKAERERCARIAERVAEQCRLDEMECDIDDRAGADWAFGGKMEARRIAAAIRSSGQEG